MRTKILIWSLLLMTFFGAKAQLPAPSGFPSPYSTGYYRIGWMQDDSGHIFPNRTPTFTPKFPFTVVGYVHTGIDTALWLWTGATWEEIGKGGGIASLTGVSPIVFRNDSILCPTCAVGGGITQLTGDGTAGPGSGSQAFTLATVNTNVGSFGDAAHVADFTVNGKGLITIAGSIPIQIAESQVTNLTSDLASKQGTITLGSTSQYFRGDLSLATFPTNLSSFTNGPGYITGITGIGAGGALAGTYPNPTLLSVITAGTCTNCALTYNAAGQITVASSGSGGGSLTGGGGFSPLFTNGVSGSTLTFTAVNAAANSVFMNNTGSSAPAAFSVPSISILNGWASGSIALLGSVQTFTATNTFNGGIAMGSSISFAANNTYAIGSSSDAASHVWGRTFNSDAAATLSSTTGNSASLAIGATSGITLLSTGQAEFNNYTGSGFTGTVNDSLVTIDPATGKIGWKWGQPFFIYAVEGTGPAGTHGDSIQLGTSYGTFYQPDTIFTAGFPFFITGLPGKGTALSTDSVLIETIAGQLYKLPIPSGGGGGGSGVTLVGPIDSAAGLPNGLRINGSSIYAQSASTTVPGMVNNAAQTFSGPKAFDSAYANNHLTHRVNQVGDSVFSQVDTTWNFGTSITAGTASGQGLPHTSVATANIYLSLGFAYQLNHDLGTIGMNRGISGTTLVKRSTGDSSMIDRIADIPRWNSNYRYITFEYLANDARDAPITTTTFAAAMVTVTDTCVARGWSLNQIIWIGAPYSGSTNNALFLPYVTQMQTTATSLGTLFANAYAYTQARDGYAAVWSDSLHPNGSGHYNIKNAILAAIPSLQRVGGLEVQGFGVIANDLTVGSFIPYPSKLTQSNSPYIATFATGDLLVNNYELGRGPVIVDTEGLCFCYPASPVNYRTGLYDNYIGFYAGGIGVTPTDNTALGRYALYGQGLASASFTGNTAIGNNAMQNALTSLDNVAIGNQALDACSGCLESVAVGYQALASATTSSATQNTANGYQALNHLTTGSGNSAEGSQSLFTLTSGLYNMGIGQFAFYTTNGNYNSGLGRSVFQNTTGTGNVGVGYTAGTANTSGSFNTYIGYSAGNIGSADSTANLSNSTALGQNAQVGCSGCAIIAGNGADAERVGFSMKTPYAMVDIPQGNNLDSFPSLHITWYNLTITSITATGSAVTIFFAQQDIPPFKVGSKVIIAGVAPSGYNGTYVITVCTRSSVTFSSSTTGTMTVAGTIVGKTIPDVIRPGDIWPVGDSLNLAGFLTGNPYNFAFTNRINYFTVPQYLNNLSGAPGTGYQILVHRTDSAWDEVPVSAIGGGVTTIGSPSTSYTNGATISGNTLTLGYATGSNPGILSTGTQTIAGTKTATGIWSFTANGTGINLIFGNSSVPGIAAGGGAGTSPTISINGTNVGGQVFVTIGTTPSGSNAIIATITFAGSSGYTNQPFITLTPANSATALLSGVTMVYASTASPLSWTINAGTTALTPATQYSWYYSITGF